MRRRDKGNLSDRDASVPDLTHSKGRSADAFCYVGDLIEGLVRIMAASNDITGPMNLRNPPSISLASDGNF